MSFAKIDALCKNLEALEHALSILHADEATNMPEGGGAKRADAVSQLAALAHEKATAPEVADWIDSAQNETLDAEQSAALAEFARIYNSQTSLSADLVRRKTEASMRCEQAWRALRPSGNWAEFAPHLEKVFFLTKEEAELRAQSLGLAPYDALMEQFDPGNRTADITPIFTDLKTFLKSFVPEALAAQEERLAKRPLKPFTGPYPIENQRALGLAAMQAVGFDFTHGRLDISHHPFCGGVPTDVRMTTRYRTDEFVSALMGILHETGHALYEQGLPRTNSHWPTNKARGMGAHESQSLFVEMQIARSEEFWQWALPLLTEHLGQEALAGWDIEDLLAQVNRVQRGLIRVDADEVTYPLHVILRYELEQELIAGDLKVSDIPAAWDAKMVEYLGLSTIKDSANGPMQDVHWPSGAFGYFPSYTLGAMMAAQQWAALEKQHPTVKQQMAKGDFSTTNQWRKDNIWSQGSRVSTPELITRATGEPLNADYFKAHLKKRYL